MPWYLQFDGKDDYATIPDSAGAYFNGSFTLAVELGEYNNGFILMYRGEGVASYTWYGLWIQIEHNRVRFDRNVGYYKTQYTRYVNGDFSYQGKPFYVVLSYDRNSGKFYVYRDSVLIGQNTTSTANIVYRWEKNYNIAAARRTAGGEWFTKGMLYHWSLWKGVCTQSEIAEIINKRYDQVSVPPAAIYEIDTGTGSVLVDSSGNNYHGTIHGATWVWVDDPVPPGRVDISATLRGSSSATAKADRIRDLSAHLTGAATSTGGEPIRIRGLSANLQGAGTTNVRMNLIAALKAHLQGQATLKSNVLVLFIPEGVYVIDADEIFAKDQPSRGQVVANYIEVWVNPLKPTEEPEEVYRSKDPVTIPAGKTETVTIQFDDEPVTEPAVALEEAGVNLSIIDTKYYAWGADVKIRNNGSGAQTCIIVATGKPLKVQGREMVVRKDEVSIQENGLKKYTFDNPFVQDRATAELIADKLLSFANAKRDIVIEWRGDPALELADVTMIPEYQRRDIDQRGIFYVTKQELEFDGGLRARLEGRKM